ncbi:MAG: response regulator [Candidatus Aegiribacteria sp.]|nr:response regulator [Candidatus Aegiribacteria sp.]
MNSANPSLRALILEDSIDDTELVVRHIRKNGFNIEWDRVQTAADMKTALETNTYDVILADYTMPQFTALDGLQILQKSGLNLPFIIVSGSIGEEIAVEALKAGANDYMMKSNLSRLCPAIEREIREVKVSRKTILAEKALEESEKKYRLLADNTIDCIWLTDLEFNFRYVNPAVYLMVGFTQDEWIGSNLSEHCHPDDIENISDISMEELKKGSESTGITFETRLLHKNGEMVPVEITGRLLLDDNEQPIGFQGITRNISERRQFEEQLRQSQKMEAIGTLAGGIAHDFNNILQAVFGYTDLASASLSEDDPGFCYVKEIRKSAERAADLTRQLLAFGRRQILMSRDINLNDLINELLKMLERLISENIKFEFIPCGKSGTVHADTGQIEQVITNLCVNARDAMPEGGSLTIETENILVIEDYCRNYPWTKHGSYMLLTVTDTGCGMDEDTCKVIFEPFFTTKDINKGSGLGLSTVYGIVRQHNGFVHVYSEKGRGTAFKVYLPIVDRPAEHITTTVKKKVPGGSETILVAEDDESVRRLVRHILEEAGYSVLMAKDGLEAIEIFEQNADSISLVLLDVVMPELSGREVNDTILKISPNMNVLFTSGYSSNAVHTRFVSEKGMKLISKPYNPGVLLNEIRIALDS